MTGTESAVSELPRLVRHWGAAARTFTWVHVYPSVGGYAEHRTIAVTDMHQTVVLDDNAVDRERLRTEISTIAAMVLANDPAEDPGRWATHDLNTGWASVPRFLTHHH